jgi:hypothetical protein
MSTLATRSGKLRTFCFGLMLAMVGLGPGLALASAAAPPAPSPPAKEEVRRDHYGDPLPPGTVMRLGTVRYRVPGEIVSLALLPDGKIVAASSHAGIFLLDTASGKRLTSWFPIVVGQDLKGVIRIRELADGQKPHDYEAANVIWLGWSATGEPLTVSLEAGALRLRESLSGRSWRFAQSDLPNRPRNPRLGFGPQLRVTALQRLRCRRDFVGLLPQWPQRRCCPALGARSKIPPTKDMAPSHRLASR